MPRRSISSTPLSAPANQIELGVYSEYNRVRFTNAVAAQGGTITWVRNYPQPATTCTAAQISAVISPLADLGLKNYTSFKSSFTWAQVASGSDDARWTSIGNMLNGITPAGAWAFNHEPENDFLNYGSAANGADFVAAWEHVAGVIKPLAPNWQASICLFDEVFPSFEFGRGANWDAAPDPNNWMSSSMDLLGVDYYAYRGASDSGSHWATNEHIYDHATAVADFLSYASAYGVKLCFPEFGHLIKDPAVDATDEQDARQPWLADFAATWAGHPQIDSIMWFEVNEQDNAGKANFSLTDDDHPPIYTPSVAAFTATGV